jgi:hypothetical protein
MANWGDVFVAALFIGIAALWQPDHDSLRVNVEPRSGFVILTYRVLPLELQASVLLRQVFETACGPQTPPKDQKVVKIFYTSRFLGLKNLLSY